MKIEIIIENKKVEEKVEREIPMTHHRGRE